MKKRNSRILIYRLGSLGDTIIALPCFHKVRQTFPDADITLLTNRPVAAKAAPIEAVLGSDYFFHRILTYPLGTRNPLILIKLIQQIWSLKIDAVVNLTTARTLQAINRDRWFFRMCGIGELIGFPNSEKDLNLSINPLTSELEWEASRLVRQLKLLGNINLLDEKNWDLRLKQEEHNQAIEILRGCSPDMSIIAISAGTKMQAKDWGEVNWIALIKRLSIMLPGWTLLMVGASDERQLAERCVQAWSGMNINLCGETSPRVSAAILQRVRVFIGHDSGPMHLAACVGTPCVAIFSARTLPKQWYPRGNFNHILYHKTDCAGCNLDNCIVQKKKCILSIHVSEVEHAVMKILNKL